MTYDYPLDLTGVAPSNLVTNEPQVITEINASFSKIIIPDYAPFYLSNLELVHISTDGTETVLQSDIDYFVAYPYQDLARETGKLCFGAIVVINPNAVNRFRLKYQTIGDRWTADPNHVKQKLLELAYNPRVAYWDQLTNVQEKFPPEHHIHDAADFDRWPELIAAINRVTTAIADKDFNESAIYPTVISYIEAFLPYKLNKEAVGLSDVENYPVATEDDIIQLAPVSKYVLLSQVIDVVNSVFTSTASVEINDIKDSIATINDTLAQFQNSINSLSQNTTNEFTRISSELATISNNLDDVTQRVSTIEVNGSRVRARNYPSAFTYFMSGI